MPNPSIKVKLRVGRCLCDDLLKQQRHVAALRLNAAPSPSAGSFRFRRPLLGCMQNTENGHRVGVLKFGNFDFTAGTSSVDIEAMVARYNNPEFLRRSMQEEDDDGPE